MKFFREPRQKSLAASKTSEYFVYAVGEIVLVVIGILIALQMNSNIYVSYARKLINIRTPKIQHLMKEVSSFRKNFTWAIRLK